MCEQTPIHYKHGDIVWVKLDLSWWPGQVIDFEALPSDLQESFSSGRKKPLVVVSFFQEENYEYVMNLNAIYSYNCTKKDDFIRRAMDLIRAKNALMDKFPSDIRMAEEMTGGNTDILADPKYGPQKKKINYASMIFGSGKKPASRSKGRPKHSERPVKGNVIHPRFTGRCDDYEVRLLVQTSIPESTVRQNKYSCDWCDFESSRIDVIVLHNKCHAHEPRSLQRPPVSPRRPQKKFKIPVSRTSTIDEDLALLEQGISLTDNESSSGEEEVEEIEEVIKPKVKRKQRATDRRKGKKAKVVAQPAEEDKKTDIRVDLLAEWDDDDDEDGESVTVNNNQSMESATTSFAETPTKPTPGKSTKTEDKSCFDFKEEEENHILTATTSSGRKIPRVIPEKRKSIEPDTSNTEDTFEADLDRFAEVLETTAAPELPSSLKCEQNFHYAKAIKFPDKHAETPPKAESTPKLINIKKRFVKSFEDFEQSLKVEKEKEDEESNRLEREILTIDENDDLKTSSSDDIKTSEISSLSVNDDAILTSLKDTTAEDSVGMEIDFQFDSMDDSLKLDNEVVIENHSASSEVTDNLLSLEITDNLDDTNKSVLTEEIDNLEQKTIAESTIDAKTDMVLSTETKDVEVMNEGNIPKTDTEPTKTGTIPKATTKTNAGAIVTKSDAEPMVAIETTESKPDTELMVTNKVITETIVGAKTDDATEVIPAIKTDTAPMTIIEINTEIAAPESSITTKTDNEMTTKPQTETLIASKTDTDTIIPKTDATTKSDTKTISTTETKTDVITKENPVVTSSEVIEDTMQIITITDSPPRVKESKTRRSLRDDDTKSRRRLAEDHMPVKKSKYSKKAVYEESRRTRTKLEDPEHAAKIAKPTRPSVDEEQKTTRTKRPSFSLDDDDGMKKLMSKLPSFSVDHSSTSSYSVDFEENLKTTRWDQRPSEAAKKMHSSQSSFSANFDEYIKKSRATRSSLDIGDASKKKTGNEDKKKTRSSRSSFSRDYEEELKNKSLSSADANEDQKKTKTTRSSSHDVEDVKKSGSTRSSFASVFEEDLKKRRSTRSSFPHDIEEDANKKTDIDEELKKKSEINEDLKKTRSTRSSSSYDIEKAGSTRSSFESVFEENLKKRKSTRSSLSHETIEGMKKRISVDTDEDLKNTRSTRSSLPCDVEEYLKKTTSISTNVDEVAKKTRSARSSFSPDLEEGVKKTRSTRSSFIQHNVDEDSKKKPSKQHDIELPSKTKSSHDADDLKKITSLDDIDEDVKETKLTRSSVSHAVYEELKKSPLPSGDIDDDLKKTTPTKSSHALDFDEDLKKTQLTCSSFSHAVHEELKKSPSKKSSSTSDIDTNLKKTTTTKSSQSTNVDEDLTKITTKSDFEEDIKKTRLTRSSFPRDFVENLKQKPSSDVNEDTKKSRSTRSSLSHDVDEDFKKKTAKPSTHSTEDLKKKTSKSSLSRADIEEDVKKTRSTRSSLFASDFDEGLRKTKSTKSSISRDVNEDSKKQHSSSADIEEELKTSISKQPLASIDVDEDLKQTRSTRYSLLHDIDGGLNRRTSAVADENMKKITNKQSTDIDTNTKKGKEKTADTEKVHPFSTVDREIKPTPVDIDLEDTNKIKQKPPTEAKKTKSKWLIIDEEGVKEIKTKSIEVEVGKKTKSVEVEKNKKSKPTSDDQNQSSLDSASFVEDTKKPKSRWSSISADTDEGTKDKSKSVAKEIQPFLPSVSIDAAEEVKKIKSKWSALLNDEVSPKKTSKSTPDDEMKTPSPSVTPLQDTMKIKSKWSAVSASEEVTKKKSRSAAGVEDEANKIDPVSEDTKKIQLKWSAGKETTKAIILEDDKKEPQSTIPSISATVDDTKKIKSKWSLVPEDYSESTTKKKSKYSDEGGMKKLSKLSTEDEGEDTKKIQSKLSAVKEIILEDDKQESQSTVPSISATVVDDTKKIKSKWSLVPEDYDESTTKKKSKCSDEEGTKKLSKLSTEDEIQSKLHSVAEDSKKTKSSKWSPNYEGGAKKKSKWSSVSTDKEITKETATFADDNKTDNLTVVAEDTNKAKSAWSLAPKGSEEYMKEESKSNLESSEKVIADDVKKEAIVAEDTEKSKSKWSSFLGDNKDSMKKKSQWSSVSAGGDTSKSSTADDDKKQTVIAEESKKAKSKSVPEDFEESTKNKSKWSDVDSSMKVTVDDGQKKTEVHTAVTKKSKSKRPSLPGHKEESTWSSVSAGEESSPITKLTTLDDGCKDVQAVIPLIIAAEKDEKETKSKLSSIPGDYEEDTKKSNSPSTEAEEDTLKLSAADDDKQQVIISSVLPVVTKDEKEILDYENSTKKESKLPFVFTDDKKELEDIIPSTSPVAAKDAKETKSKLSSVPGDFDDGTKKKSKWSSISPGEEKISALDDDKKDIQAGIPSVSTITITDSKESKWPSVGTKEDGSKKKSKCSSIPPGEDKLSAPNDDKKDIQARIPSVSTAATKDPKETESKWPSLCTKEEGTKKKSKWSSIPPGEEKLSAPDDDKKDIQARITSDSTVATRDPRETESMWPSVSTKEDSLKIILTSSSAADDDKIEIEAINLSTSPLAAVDAKELKPKSSSVPEDYEDGTKKKSKWASVAAEEDSSKLNAADDAKQFEATVSSVTPIEVKESMPKWLSVPEDKKDCVVKKSKSTDDRKDIPSASPLPAKESKSKWSSFSGHYEEGVKKRSEWSLEEDSPMKLSTFDDDKKEIQAMIPSFSTEDTKKAKSKWTTVLGDSKDDANKKMKWPPVSTEEGISKLGAGDDVIQEIQVPISSAPPIASKDMKESESKWSTPGDYEEGKKSKWSSVSVDENSSEEISKSSGADGDKNEIPSVSTVPVEDSEKCTIADDDKTILASVSTVAAEDTKNKKWGSKWSSVPGDFDESIQKKSKRTYSRGESKRKSRRSSVAAEESRNIPKWSSVSSDNTEEVKEVSKWSSVLTDAPEKPKEVLKLSSASSNTTEESMNKSKSSSVSSDGAVDSKTTSNWIPVLTDPTKESKKTSSWSSVLSDATEESKLSSAISDATEESKTTSKWIPVSTDVTKEFKKTSSWSSVSSDGDESTNKSKWFPADTKISASSHRTEDTKIRFKWSIPSDLEGGPRKRSTWVTDDDTTKVMSKFPSRSCDREEHAKKIKSRWSSDSPDHEDTKKKSKWFVEEDVKKLKPAAVEARKSSHEKLGERSGLCLKVSKLKSRLMDKLHESEIELQRPKPKTWIQQKAEERLHKRRLSAKSPRRLSLQSQELSIEKAVDKVEVTINTDDATQESSSVNVEEKQIVHVPELRDDIIGSVEVKIPIGESKLESLLRSPALPQEDDENSALNTLATISELSSYDLCKSDINIEKNLTVVSESDLGDAQVEIAKIPIIEEGTVKATTVASFSVDFTEDLSVLENKKKLTVFEDLHMLENKNTAHVLDSHGLENQLNTTLSQDSKISQISESKGESSGVEAVDIFDYKEDIDLLEGTKEAATVDMFVPKKRDQRKFRILEDVAIFEKREKPATYLGSKSKSLVPADDDKVEAIGDAKVLKNKEVAVLEEKTMLEGNEGVDENKVLRSEEGATVLEEKDISVAVLEEEVITTPILEDDVLIKGTSAHLYGCNISETPTVGVNTSLTLEGVDLFENKKTCTNLEDAAVIEHVDKNTTTTTEGVNVTSTSIEENKASKIQEGKVTKKIDILSDVKIPEVATIRSRKASLPLKKFAERQFLSKKFIEQIANSVEMEMAKLTDTSMDTTIVEQPQESTTSTKLLEILTDPKVPKTASSHTPQLKIANPKFELESAPHPPKPKTKLLIRSSLPGSSRTGGKQMIISDKVIKTTKEVHSSPVSVQKTNDTEGIEAFIIHKKDTISEGLKVTKKSMMKKPTILDHTIIKPKDEVTPSKSDENVFDIDSMPIVLTDQILTPENIDKVPIMIPTEKPAPKVLPGKMKLLNKTPLTKEAVSIRSPHFSKGLKPQKIFQHHSIARQGASIMNQAKGKMVIVPSEASTSTMSKYTVGKRLVKKIPSTTIASGSQKLHNLQEPTGNKIMIVTNNQGQQSRVVLTPAQQKLIGYQSPTLKKVVKGGKSANIISQTIINSKGQITTTNQGGITSTTSSLTQVKRPKIEPSRNKVLGQKLLLQSSLNQLKPGQPRTIIIKNPQGQTVKKIHGTDDALLEKQVQEQIEAINRATWSQGSVKTVPKKYSKKPLADSTKIALQQKAQLTNSSGASSSKAAGIPPLSPIIKKTETQVKPKPVSPKAPPSPAPPEIEKVGEKRAPHQLVIQDALGNQTTITEGQILALPSETVDGQPQSYMLVTLDETGNLTPLNNEALMSLDPNLNLGGDLSNMVLQIDQGAANAEASPETPSPPTVTEEPKVEEVVTVEETEVVPIVEPEKPVTESPQPVDPTGMQAVTCAINNGESNQQLIITGDPASTQKFLESLSEGNADLANLLANTEGNILIHADGQQILINTDADNPLLLSMNSDGTSSMESGEGSGNPIFSSQAPKNQDILAAALADTDVFQQEQSIMSAKVTQPQLSPTPGALYPINVNNVLETSSMSSPIMTPLEVPSTNSKKIDMETDILSQVPKNVDLPITITDPNIAHTVAHQQAALMSSDLHTNLELPLAIQDVTVTSAEMNSPTFTYALPHLDDSVDMQKPFTNSISMPLLTEISDDVATTASTTLPSEIIEVEHDKEILVETTMISEEIHEETVVDEPITIPDEVKKTDSQYLLATSGLPSISNQMCSSLSEPPPDMFDFTIDQSYDLKQEISPPVTESPVDDEFLDAEKTESESEQASFTPQSNSPSTNSTDSCEIPVQPEIVTDISSKSSESELRPFDDDEKM